MNEYELPDGTVLQFEEGTSPEIIQKAIKSVMGRSQAQAPAQKKESTYAGMPTSQAGGVRKFLGGVKNAWDNAAYGLKGMFTDLTAEEKALLESGKQFVDEAGFAGGAGRLAGDIAMTAAPGYRGMQAVSAVGKVLPSALKAVRGAGIVGTGAAAAGTGAAIGAATSPLDREGGATAGAVGGVVGELGGRVLQKALSGPLRNSITPEARQMVDSGVDVPFWKSTSNKTIRNLGERARALPLAGTLMKGQERRAMEQWNRQILDKANPPLPTMSDAGQPIRWSKSELNSVGHQAIEELRNRFSTAYDALYEGRVVPIDDAFYSEIDDLVSSVKRYYPSIGDDVEGIANKITDNIKKITQANTPQVPKSFSTTPEVLESIRKDAVRAPDVMVPHLLEQDARGVMPGKLRELDRAIVEGKLKPEDISLAFNGTRNLLRSQYGDNMILWRADAPAAEQTGLTAYFGAEDLAKRFEEEGVRKAQPYLVNMEDILAAYAPSGSNGGNYAEFVVRRPEKGFTPFTFPKDTSPRHAGITYDSAKVMRSEIDDLIEGAWRRGDAERGQALEGIRDALVSAQNRALPPEVQSMKAPIDDAYKSFKRIQRASGMLGAASRDGVFSPQQLLGSARALDRTPGKSAFSMGRAPMQQEAAEGTKVLGSELPDVGPGTAEKLMLMGTGAVGIMNPKLLALAAAATPQGQRALQGGYAWQGKLRSNPEILADILRGGGIAMGSGQD